MYILLFSFAEQRKSQNFKNCKHRTSKCNYYSWKLMFIGYKYSQIKNFRISLAQFYDEVYEKSPNICFTNTDIYLESMSKNT